MSSKTENVLSLSKVVQ